MQPVRSSAPDEEGTVHLSIMEFEGDPDELLAKLREHIAPVARRLAREFGGISSTTVRTDTGLMVINLWKDAEGRHRLPEHAAMRAAIARAGLEPTARGYPVLIHETADEVPGPAH
jgi:hypothetical protein